MLAGVPAMSCPAVPTTVGELLKATILKRSFGPRDPRRATTATRIASARVIPPGPPSPVFIDPLKSHTNTMSLGPVDADTYHDCCRVSGVVEHDEVDAAAGNCRVTPVLLATYCHPVTP